MRALKKITVEGFLVCKKEDNILLPSKYKNKGHPKYRLAVSISDDEKVRIEEIYNELALECYRDDELDGMTLFFKDCNESVDLEKYPHLQDFWTINASTAEDYPPKFGYIDNGKGRRIHDTNFRIPPGCWVKASLTLHPYESAENFGIAAYFNGLLVLEFPQMAQELEDMFGVEMHEDELRVIESRAVQHEQIEAKPCKPQRQFRRGRRQGPRRIEQGEGTLELVESTEEDLNQALGVER